MEHETGNIYISGSSDRGNCLTDAALLRYFHRRSFCITRNKVFSSKRTLLTQGVFNVQKDVEQLTILCSRSNKEH